MTVNEQYSATILSINQLTALPQPMSAANQNALLSLSQAAANLAGAIASNAANSPVLGALTGIQTSLSAIALATQATARIYNPTGK